MTKRPEPAPDAAPETASAPSSRKGYAHTLSLRLTAEQYRRLRRFVVRLEDRTGERLSHQAVIETALTEYLTRMEE